MSCHWFDYQHHSCWLISVKNRSPSSENVMCLATQQSRDLVLANHRMNSSMSSHGLSNQEQLWIQAIFAYPTHGSNVT